MVDLLATLGAIVFVPICFSGMGMLVAAVGPSKIRPANLWLLGVVGWGAIGLLRTMTGISAGATYASVAVIGLAVLALRRFQLLEIYRTWRRDARMGILIYGFALIALTISPFPGQSLLGGDWWEHFQMTLAVHSGAFGAKHLARSPFFAVAALPVVEFGGGLAAFQAFSAFVAAAAWWPLIDYVDSRHGGRRWYTWAAWCAIGLSPFFTQLLQNLWPKFFAGGCFWLATVRLRDWRVTAQLTDAWAAGAWFAAAVLAHEATILLSPLWLTAGWIGPTAGGRAPVKGLALALLAAGFGVGLWEGWTLWKFGLEARVAINPAVTFDTGLPLGSKLWSNTVGTVVSQLPGILYPMWIHGLGGHWPYKVYFTWVALLSWPAATIFGIGWPWVLGAGPTLWRLARPLATARGIAILGAILSCVTLHSLVLGSAPKYGAVQAGLVPLIMWVAGHGLARLDDRDERAVQRVLGFVLVFGWMPYFLTGICVGGALLWPGPWKHWADTLRGSDGDLVRILADHMHPLGLQPPLAIIGWLAATLVTWRAARLWCQ